jgi:hypothetical protein
LPKIFSKDDKSIFFATIRGNILKMKTNSIINKNENKSPVPSSPGLPYKE